MVRVAERLGRPLLAFCLAYCLAVIVGGSATGRRIRPSLDRDDTRVLGTTAEEAVGQRLELIIPARLHEAHRNGMARHTAAGEGHVIGTTVELAARTKNGVQVRELDIPGSEPRSSPGTRLRREGKVAFPATIGQSALAAARWRHRGRPGVWQPSTPN